MVVGATLRVSRALFLRYSLRQRAFFSAHIQACMYPLLIAAKGVSCAAGY
jgi:hypothetical protein